jgi:hypothetical protein
VLEFCVCLFLRAGVWLLMSRMCVSSTQYGATAAGHAAPRKYVGALHACWRSRVLAVQHRVVNMISKQRFQMAGSFLPGSWTLNLNPAHAPWLFQLVVCTECMPGPCFGCVLLQHSISSVTNLPCSGSCGSVLPVASQAQACACKAHAVRAYSRTMRMCIAQDQLYNFYNIQYTTLQLTICSVPLFMLIAAGCCSSVALPEQSMHSLLKHGVLPQLCRARRWPAVCILPAGRLRPYG